MEEKTLKDLQQKLINYLYNISYYGKEEIELIKVLLENNDI